MTEFNLANQGRYRRRKCKACVDDMRKDLWQRRPESKASTALRAKASHLRLKYGIDLDDYFKMLDDQGNKCAICQRDLSNGLRQNAPHVDHDHTTGFVRGILCFTCNTALGKLQDDIPTLLSAVGYLEMAEERYERSRD